MSQRHYISKASMSQQVRESQALGLATELFGESCLKIAEAVRKTFFPWLDADEFCSMAVLAMLKKLYKIDPEQNPFSYLTQSAKNTGRTMERKRTRDREHFAAYLADAVNLAKYRQRRECDSHQLEGLEECE